MRAVIQRVSFAEVRTAGDTIARIGRGYVMLLGVARPDTQADVDYIAAKTLALRAFPDREGKMNHSIRDIGGEVLVVSQFTLCSDCRRGRRPSFSGAAPPQTARRLYEDCIRALQQPGIRVATGTFQAMMEVSLCNDGPVTFLLDSARLF